MDKQKVIDRINAEVSTASAVAAENDLIQVSIRGKAAITIHPDGKVLHTGKWYVSQKAAEIEKIVFDVMAEDPDAEATDAFYELESLAVTAGLESLGVAGYFEGLPALMCRAPGCMPEYYTKSDMLGIIGAYETRDDDE